jgi:hypothetical protein
MLQKVPTSKKSLLMFRAITDTASDGQVYIFIRRDFRPKLLTGQIINPIILSSIFRTFVPAKIRFAAELRGCGFPREKVIEKTRFFVTDFLSNFIRNFDSLIGPRNFYQKKLA